MTAKGLGLWHSVDMRDALHTMRAHLAGVDVLPDYKIWEHGQILDQGFEGSCVGMGWTDWENCKPIGYAVQQDYEYAYRWYERAKELDAWPGTDYEGTSVRAGAKVGQERGLLEEYVWAASLDELDAWLLAKGPIVVACDWFNSMDDPISDGFLRVNPNSGIRGGHCFLLYGKGSGGNYRFVNSWGYDYADEGTFRLTPEDVQTLINVGRFQACSSPQVAAA